MKPPRWQRLTVEIIQWTAANLGTHHLVSVDLENKEFQLSFF